MVKNKLHHCECSECAERGEEIDRLKKLLETYEEAMQKIANTTNMSTAGAELIREFARTVVKYDGR